MNELTKFIDAMRATSSATEKIQIIKMHRHFIGIRICLQPI